MAAKRKLRNPWLENEDFKPWLSRVEGDPSRAFCTTCKRDISAELTAIKRHKVTRMHITNVEKLEAEVQQENPSTSGVVCFIAEHNLPFTTADHLVTLMKVMFPDSGIAQHMSMGRTKCTEVVKSLGKCVMDDIVKKLRESMYSIIIDETTDISAGKSCTVIVRYLDNETNTIKTGHLQIFDVYGEKMTTVGSTGHSLFTLLITGLDLQLTERQILWGSITRCVVG